jgi:AcrR family transcriptional regulator
MSRQPGKVRKRQIAEAALMLLARDGVSGFTTANLALAVGMSDAALFRHFPNLNAILDAAVTELEILLFPEDAARDEDASLEGLHTFLQRRARILRERPGVLRILFSNELGRAGNSETEQRVLALRRRSQAKVSSYLRQAIDEGLVRDDFTIKELVSIVHGLFLALIFSVERGVSGGFESSWGTFLRLVRKQGVGT